MTHPLSPNSPAAALGTLLVREGLALSTAESCTGGLVAAALTDVPGSSQWFMQGVVTYSNQAKMHLLGVQPHTLERFGAVSQETAREMAAGALQSCDDAQVAVSTTGIAGPGGATPGKPVGTVCFGFARRTPEGIVTEAAKKWFSGNRQQVRDQSVTFALSGLADFIQGQGGR